MAYKIAIMSDVSENTRYTTLAESITDKVQSVLEKNNYETINIKIEGGPSQAKTVADYTACLDENNPNLIISVKIGPWKDSETSDMIYTQHESSTENKIANCIKKAFPSNIKINISKGQVLSYYKDVPMLKFAPKYPIDVGVSAGDYIAQGILNYLRGEGVKNQPSEQYSDEPSYALMETEDVPVNIDFGASTFKKPVVSGSIDKIYGETLPKIYDKQLTIHSDYLVYFDNVLMNDYVLSYTSNIGINVGIGNASVELVYAPSFRSIGVNDDISDGIENGTQLRIFVSNVFSGKYKMVFDGIIKQRILSRDSSGFKIVFTAVDYVYWMNKIIAPISIPFNQAISPGERLKWKAQSIDPEKTANVVTAKAGSLKGKSIQEYFDTLKEKSFTNSNVCSDSNGVINWDDTINRVEIMGDINPILVRDQVIDFVINSNSVFADTVYVSMANTTNNLMMEFYQDRDGIIRIKPPFWNEPVLKNHVIDPMMVISSSESTDWTKYYTRIIVTGGVEEWMPESGSSSSKVDLLTPVGVYLGSLTDKEQAKWADYTSEGERGSSYGVVTTNEGSGNSENSNEQSSGSYSGAIQTDWKWNGTLGKRSLTDYIVLHHAAAVTCSARDIDNWHKDNGWAGIGYHYFVRKNGKIYAGRPEWATGSHVLNMNHRSLGICAEGNYDREQEMPQSQKDSIIKLIKDIRTRYPNAKIVGHKDIGSSDCPGRYYPLNYFKNYNY